MMRPKKISNGNLAKPPVNRTTLRKYYQKCCAIIYCIECSGKGKVVAPHAMEMWEIGGITPLLLNLGVRSG
jgi:hypothetical protein